MISSNYSGWLVSGHLISISCCWSALGLVELRRSWCFLRGRLQYRIVGSLRSKVRFGFGRRLERGFLAGSKRIYCFGALVRWCWVEARSYVRGQQVRIMCQGFYRLRQRLSKMSWLLSYSFEITTSSSCLRALLADLYERKLKSIQLQTPISQLSDHFTE